jgi:hypothetical protein
MKVQNVKKKSLSDKLNLIIILRQAKRTKKIQFILINDVILAF